MNNRIFSIVIELAYIIIAIFCFVTGYLKRDVVSEQYEWTFYAMGILSIAMFIFRLLTRKSREKRQKKYNLDK